MLWIIWFLHYLKYSFITSCSGHRIHWFYFPIWPSTLIIAIETPTTDVSIVDVLLIYGTSLRRSRLLPISEWLLIIGGSRLHSIITTNFYYWWGLFHWFDGTLFSWLVVRIQRAITFNGVHLDRPIRLCSFMKLSIWVICNGTTLRCYSYYCRLISSTLKIGVSLWWIFPASCFLWIYFYMSLTCRIHQSLIWPIEFLLLISTRCGIVIMILQSWFGFAMFVQLKCFLAFRNNWGLLNWATFIWWLNCGGIVITTVIQVW